MSKKLFLRLYTAYTSNIIIKFLCVGTVFMIIWFLASLLDSFFLHKGNLYDQLFIKNGYEIWTRLLIISLIYIFSFYTLWLLKQQNLTENKFHKSNRALQIHNEFNKSLLYIKKEFYLLKALCLIALETGGYKTAWISLTGENKTLITDHIASAGYDETELVEKIISMPDQEFSQTPAGKALQTLHPVINHKVSDISDPLLNNLHKNTEKNKYASSAAFPVLLEGTVMGVVNLYSAETDIFDNDEIKLLTGLTNDLAYGLRSLRLNKKQSQAETALQENEMHFQNLLSSVNDVVWAATADGEKILYVNPATERIYGISPGDFLKNPNILNELIHPDDREDVKNSLIQLFSKRQVENEYRIIRSDGEIRWLNDRKSVKFDKSGIPIQIGGIITDITNRKQSEKVLYRQNEYLTALHKISLGLIKRQKQDELLETIINHAKDLGGTDHGFIYLYNPEKNQLEVRVGIGRFSEAVGLKIEPGQGLSGKAWQQEQPIVVDDYHKYQEKIENKAFKDLKACISVPLKSKAGVIGLGCFDNEKNKFGKDEIDILTRFSELASVVLDNVRLYENFQFEITERKKAEDALRKSEERLRAQFQGLPVPTYIWKKSEDDFVLIDFNDAVIFATNGSICDSIGVKAGVLYKETPEIHHELKKCFSEQKTIERDFQFKISDTEENKHVSIRFAFVPPDLVLVHTDDITEKKAMQAETMRAGHLASLGELAAGVAHEINNPINGIISLGEILKSQCDKNGNDDEIPTRIINEGERIAKIVRNLLSFARDWEEEPGPVDIIDIVSDTLGLIEKQISKNGINLSVNIPPDLPKVKALRQEIQQVFINILSNAQYALNQKFPGFDEQKTLEIRSEVIETDGIKKVRTLFYDQGTGIPEKVLEKIMNPFFSTKPKGEGTGLGLSISHGIIKNHDGNLEFKSMEGKYTRVTVDLPVVTDG